MKVSIAAAAAFLFAAVEAKTLLLPIPQTVQWTGSQAQLSNDFKITGAKNHHVVDAAKRYNKLIHKESWIPVQVTPEEHLKKGDTLKSLHIDVKNNNVKLDAGVDESYVLDIPAKGGKASLTAKTWVGALRGLETFSQLVEAKDGKKNNGKLVAHTAKITDAPTYEHRGILLDTSRNYYPVKDIIRTIDALAFNKMNVLHWHVTDSQSWPLVSKSYPELTKAAYTPEMIYTAKDVQQIIKYGESRGVRIVVEIDMPAHTDSISASHPELVACSHRDSYWWGTYAGQPPAGQLNVVNKGTKKLVKSIVKEFTGVFPDSYYHTGGDELNAKCWPTNKEITDYVKKHNVTYNDVWFDFTNDIIKQVGSYKKKAIIWEDPIRDGGDITTDATVQVWLAPPSVYTKKGHDVILTPYDYAYLDCGHGGYVADDERYLSPTQAETKEDTFNYGGGGGSWCSPFKTWQRIYSYDMTYGIEKSHKGRVLGGEVALWSEQSGPTVVDARLWPRASAAAEIYWSGSYDKKGARRHARDADARINDWAWRLMSRGLNAEPTTPRWCLTHPGECDLNDPKAKKSD